MTCFCRIDDQCNSFHYAHALVAAIDHCRICQAMAPAWDEYRSSRHGITHVCAACVGKTGGFRTWSEEDVIREWTSPTTGPNYAAMRVVFTLINRFRKAYNNRKRQTVARMVERGRVVKRGKEPRYRPLLNGARIERLLGVPLFG